MLEELGIVRHAHGADGREEFHVLPVADHGHLHCRSCGESWEIGVGEAAVLVAALRAERGFTVELSHLSVAGPVPGLRAGCLTRRTGSPAASRAGVVPVVPGPGQESVWDYPRPPRLEPVPERIRVVVDGVAIADTTRAVRVLETAAPPVYYVPPEDVRMDLLRPSPTSSQCEWKGAASYWSLGLGRAPDRGPRVVLRGPGAGVRGDPRLPRLLRIARSTRPGWATSSRHPSRAASTAAG